MPYLAGIETLAIGREKTIELSYVGGQFVDQNDEVVPMQDVLCYQCANKFYVLEAEPIDYCPHCGDRNKRTWATYEDARKWAWGQKFDYMHELGYGLFAVRLSDGNWVPAVARNSRSLLAGGRVVDARSLVLEGPQ